MSTFNGYVMSTEEVSKAEAVLSKMVEMGLDSRALDDFWKYGVCISDVSQGSIIWPSAAETALLARILHNTGDIPYHIVDVGTPMSEIYYVLCIPGDDESRSNFGAEMNGLDGALAAASGDGYACAAVSYSDELPEIVQTTLVGIDCSGGFCKLS